MDLSVAWKKVLLFGALGAVGCLAGWLVGEPFLAIYDAVARSAGAGQGPTLISKPTEPPPPSPEFQDRLKQAGAKSGDIQISLIWFNTNDLDLHCIDPSGFEIFWKPEHRRSRTRGELDVDRNAGCNRVSHEPVENIYWGSGPPLGRYRVYLNFYQRCPGAESETKYKVSVLHAGQRKEFSGTITPQETPEGGPLKHIYEFYQIEVTAPAAVELGSSPQKVAFSVRRGSYQGKLEVKAENLPGGVTAEPVTLQPDQSDGELILKSAGSTNPGETKIRIVASGENAINSTESTVKITTSGTSFSLLALLAIGFWTALLAVGLCVALVAGQNHYLGKALFASGRVPLVMVLLGALAAGFVSGTVGQTFYSLLLMIDTSLGVIGRIFGWMLLGVLLGWGVSFFVPNLDPKKSALAGLAGGFLGGLAFAIMSWIAGAILPWAYVAGMFGRFGGAALLGFCIGLMVAVVEAAFRRAWLEVRFSAREVITVNLGPEPVKVGGNSRLCTVWARGAAEVALRYWIRDARVHCEDVPTKQESTVGHGDTREVGNVTVVVRTTNSSERGSDAPGPSQRASKPLPPPLPTVAPPQAVSAPPAMQPVPIPPAMPQAAPAPATPPAPPAKAAEPDWDDGLPMPMAPPPPPRPATASILDIEDLLAARAATPQAAQPSAPAKPPTPTIPSAPPVPSAAKPPSPAPSAPKVPAPPTPVSSEASAAKPAGDPDACPSCGRKSPGKPGARYCMVCDRTF